ncbi:MAG TPA: hypothetical protein VMI54_16815 [Polyangiaceae bacterium]|nr:hypothetical protein [Polyangiaceae bacterium]
MSARSLRSNLARGVTAFALVLTPHVARANGRYPAANQLVVDPDDPEHFLLRATYGLLSSHDGGETFSWICEDVLGDVGEADPAVAIVRDGRLVVTANDQLMLSDATGCEFTSALADQSAGFPVDVSLDPADDSLALAVARSGDGSGTVHLLEIDAISGTARVTGTSLGNDLFPLTLDGAPSAPERWYVTALSTAPASILLRSDDRGNTWQRVEVHPYEKLQAYLAAVDPNDENTVYVRVNDDPDDHLLVSHDAGDHFVDVSGFETKLLGFALAPDGDSLAVGGPGVPVWLANAGDLDFQPVGGPFSRLSCLKWTAAGIFACADDRSDGFTLGLSADTGATFTPLFHASELTPLACDASTTVGSTCPGTWSSVVAQLGTAPTTSTTSSGSSSSATPGRSSQTASCAATRSEAGPSAPWFFAVALGAAHRRRRERRAGRTKPSAR